MSILSFEFLVLVGVLALVNYCLPVRFRWVGMLAGSMVFFLNSGWEGLVFLPAVTLLPWGAAWVLYRGVRVIMQPPAKKPPLPVEGEEAPAEGKRPIVKQLLMAAAVLLTLAISYLALDSGLDIIAKVADKSGPVWKGGAFLSLISLVLWGSVLVLNHCGGEKKAALEGTPAEAADKAKGWYGRVSILVVLALLVVFGRVLFMYLDGMAKIASALYAGWSGYVYLCVVTLVTWLAGMYMVRCRTLEKAAAAEQDRAEVWRRENKRKKFLTLTLLLVIGGMAFIKYANIFYVGADWLHKLICECRDNLKAWNIVVPLGLSYFTFQSVGYVVDCARGKVVPETNPLKYLLFLSFFPQITQGPITTHKQLMPQLMSPARFDPESFVSGFQLMLWGFFKKMVVADRLAYITAMLTKGETRPGWFILLGVVAYAIRLYGDFSGGMDVIRGAAKMIGVDMADNFRRPFFSTSVAEYWRRWHISLGTWFRSYLFYPLTTSRFGLMLSKWGQRVLGKKAGRALPGAVATFVIFFLIGIWHVANWNAVIYGAYFGILLGGALLVDPLLKWLHKKQHELDVMLIAKAKELFDKKTMVEFDEDKVIAEGQQVEAAPVEAPVAPAPKKKGAKPVTFWGKVGHIAANALRMMRTWALILVAQYFAFTSSPAQGWALLKGTFTNWNFSNAKDLFIISLGLKLADEGVAQRALTEYTVLIAALVILLVVDLLMEFGFDVNKKLARSFFLIRWVVLFALILTVLIFGVYGAGFDASAFVYTNF